MTSKFVLSEQTFRNRYMALQNIIWAPGLVIKPKKWKLLLCSMTTVNSVVPLANPGHLKLNSLLEKQPTLSLQLKPRRVSMRSRPAIQMMPSHEKAEEWNFYQRSRTRLWFRVHGMEYLFNITYRH